MLAVFFMVQKREEGGDPVTGHIISTTIGGKNGEPKRVSSLRRPGSVLSLSLARAGVWPNVPVLLRTVVSRFPLLRC
jgi:hypothetical protein